MVSIYTISDAKTGIVHYVGVTKQPLKNRLSGHRSEGRLPIIKNPDCAPIIEEIDRVSPVDAEFFERHWIQVFRGWGFLLSNNKRLSSYPLSIYSGKTKHEDNKRTIRVIVNISKNDLKAYQKHNKKSGRTLTDYYYVMPKWIQDIQKITGINNQDFKISEKNKLKIEAILRNIC